MIGSITTDVRRNQLAIVEVSVAGNQIRRLGTHTPTAPRLAK